MHLWIQNAGHTWRDVVSGRSVEPVSGEVRVPGFRRGVTYEVEWWDTYALTPTILNLHEVVADTSGDLTLHVDALLKDVAIKVRSRTAGKASHRERKAL
jgi:hypothetical protein